MNNMKDFCLALAASVLLTACATNHREAGFVSLFDGQTLKGWKHIGGPPDGYGVKDGVIFCSTNGLNLFTEQTFSNFVLRFEFKLADGSNNGIGIRAPYWGNAAYAGLEIQVLDDEAAETGRWGKLRPEQYHGSIYDLVAAKRGSLNPVGQWNTEEITADGRRVKVVVNSKTVVDANLDAITDPEKLRKHPGLLNAGGHIGFLGHGRYVEFRNIRIKQLP